MSKRSQRRATLDTAIADAWNRHERTAPGISAKRLFEMGRADTVDVDRQIEALQGHAERYARPGSEA